MAEIVVLGDSHIIAIQRAHIAAGECPVAGRSVFISRFAKLKVETGRTLPGVTFDEAVERVGRLGPDDLVVSVIGGNEFNVLGMIQHPVPFDYFEPDMPAPPRSDAQLIPCGVLDSIFDSRFDAKVTPQIRKLREATAAPIVHLAAPPPKEDNAFVLERADTVFKARNVAILGVSPASLRLKLWITQLRLLRRACARLGAAVLPPPPEALTPAGFLDPRYYGADATHANADYGALVLEKIGEHLALEQAA